MPDTIRRATPAMGLERKPADDEIDVYALSDRGTVRPRNEDRFLLASVHKRVHVHDTNLAQRERLTLADARIAFVAMVADGVGSGSGGDRASELALEVATQYLTSCVECYERADALDQPPEQMADRLQDAALLCHEAVQQRAQGEPDIRTMATTLTIWMGVWPWYYLLQVGDSRYYLYREGRLTQVTRDQTVAQDLYDQGVFTRAVAQRSQYAHVLSSSIGGPTSVPVVTRLRSEWDNVHLLCTDGLTKHVSDERIAQRLATMTSARQVCEQLLQDALDGGGTDNITIIVGRALPRPAAP